MTRTAFLFPGQGAQTVGMARTLVESLPAARELFDRAARILGYDLLALCLDGPKERLDATDVSQPAIFVSSLAALESLKQSEPAALDECVATAGLSLGEYTALVFAGAMGFEDGLRLVQQRGRVMQAAADATPSGMVSVLALEQPAVEAIVAEVAAEGLGPVRIANFLCPGNLVVSGTAAACDRVVAKVEATGAKSVRLAVAGAFHTEIMKPADAQLAEALRGVPFATPRVPVWSNVDAAPHTQASEFPELLVRQVVQPVLWEPILRGLLEQGVERFYEIGPGRVLAGLLKRVLRKADCRNVTA